MTLLLALGCSEYKAPLHLDTLWFGTTAPNRGHVVAELVDDRGNTVTDWTPQEFTLVVDGVEVEADFHGWDHQDVAQRTVVLIDLSEGAAIGPLKTAARAAIEQLEGEVALVGFAGEVQVFYGMSRDKDALLAALGEFEILGATSDVNAALVEVLGQWEETLDVTEGGMRGAVLLISDGGDVAETTTVAQVQEAAAGRPIVTLGIGTDFDDVATHGSFEAQDDEDLPQVLQDALASLNASREGLIWVSWCGSGDVAELSFQRGRFRGSLLETLNGAGLSDSAPWGQVTPLPEPIQAHHARVVGDHLYIGGGDWEGSIFYAKQLQGGLLGHFNEGPAVPDPGAETRFGAWDGQLVAINGDKAWLLSLNDDGSPTEWQDMESPNYANAIREWQGTLYSVSRQHVYIYDGSTWSQSEAIPDDGLDGHVGATIADGRVYVVGAYRENATDPWETRGWSASVDTLDDWTPLPSFAHYMGYFSTVDGDGSEVLVFPGSDADALDILRLDGSSWATAGSLAVSRDYFSTAFSPDGLLYLHGGKVEGDRTTTGYVSRLQDGQLSLTCP